LLPDEDTINILIRKCYEEVRDWWGIDSHFEDYDHWLEHESDEEEETRTGRADEEEFVKQIAELFHQKAKSPGDDRLPTWRMLTARR
jgi:hypothetical protein